MSYAKAISLSNLLLDPNNPRLQRPGGAQRNVLQAMAEHSPQKLTNLLEDIAENGLHKSELPIVIPSEEVGKFVVLEGNRRVTALKLLENPSLADGLLGKSLEKKLKAASQKYHDNPVDKIECRVFENFEAAANEIEKKHTGMNGGIGIVEWMPEEKSRFASRNEVLQEPKIQVLDFMIQNGIISDQDRKIFPISNLERMLSTPEIRQVLGIDIKKKFVTLIGKKEDVIAALRHVAHELISEKTNVNKIRHAKDRRDYAYKFPPKLVVKPQEGPPTPLIPQNNGATSPESQTTPSTSRPARVYDVKERTTVVPNTCKLNINNAKVLKCFRELRKLDITKYELAASVLLRVFFELSVDSYIKTNNIQLSGKDEKTLNSKTCKSIDHLKSQNSLTDDEQRELKHALNFAVLKSKVILMNQYVHSEILSACPVDLRNTWNSFELLFKKIWA